MVDKLINGARYRYSKTKKHRAAINEMMQERDELLNYTSAFDYISTLELYWTNDSSTITFQIIPSTLFSNHI